MDLPVNTFKRAIKAGKQQIGLWSSLSSNITVEVIAGSGFDWILIDTEHSPNELPMVLSWKLQAAVGRYGASDRPPGLERYGPYQALPRCGSAELPDPLRPDRGRSPRGGCGDALSAQGSTRICLGQQGIALRPGEGLLRPCRRGNLRSGPDRNPAGAGQSGSHCAGRRRGWRLHRPPRAVGGTRVSRQPRPSWKCSR